ncbi:hypothetical protein BGY98DRAFT_70019 [Russula aff. rugulosa BPL654]|nr:hypothetical protein BGY98DRAFT_70019 [Russula aff. rugulosa BPL654]
MGRAVPDNRVHILSVMVIDLGRWGGDGHFIPSFIARGRSRITGAHDSHGCYRPRMDPFGVQRDLPAPWGPFPNPMGIRGPALAILDRSRGSTEVARARFALHPADRVTKRIVPINRSNTWERAIGRIKWVMNTYFHN